MNPKMILPSSISPIVLNVLDAYNDAIDFFKKLIEKSPYCEIKWYQLGLFYNKIKDYKQAIIALDYAILIDGVLLQVTTKRLAV